VIELRDRLAYGARLVQSPEGQGAAWSAALDHGSSELSTVHTARALLALNRAIAVRPDREDIKGTIEAGMRWLKSNVDFTLFDETIRRAAGYDTDQIVVGQFTPAWVARALMELDSSADIDLLREAIRLTVARQRSGTWLWQRSGTKPIWMAYQGTKVLQAYAARNLPWPP
jgi:hypothetical protein